MSIAIANTTGDGVEANMLDTSIQLPDVFPDNVAFVGTVRPIGGAPYTLTGSPILAPGVPGSGSIWWNLQVDPGSGAVTLQQSTLADPAAVVAPSGTTLNGGNCIVFFRQRVDSTSGTDPAVVSTDSTPDDW